MIGPGYLVYIAGGVKRDDAKIRAVSQATGLGLYDAKVMLGAPGPRKLGAFAKEEEALALAVALRQGGLTAFVIDKDRFSRAPRIFKALKAVEDENGLVFTVETAPAPGEINARTLELPQPRGIVQAVVLGFYTQTTVHSDGARAKVMTTSKTQSREPFLHLYSEDPHTILEIAGPRFQIAWHQKLQGVMGEPRWLKLAEMFAEFYKAKLDTTIFKTPDEVAPITAALNVDAVTGQAGKGVATSTSSADDAPVAMAASRIIVYSLVFGL